MARADLLLSGEMRFHDFLQARANGLALILPGHYATEALRYRGAGRTLARTIPSTARLGQ